MNSESKNDCANCQKYFIVKDGWNSEYCSKECRDQAMEENSRERVDNNE